jgi:hypothetical protein
LEFKIQIAKKSLGFRNNAGKVRKNGNSFYYLFEKEVFFRHFPSSMQILLQYLEQ